jgi:hypothetical protein
MRVRDKERGSTAGPKGLSEIFLSFTEVEVMVQVRSRHISERFAVRWILLQDLFQLRDCIVVLLTMNKIENAGERRRIRRRLNRSMTGLPNSGREEPKREEANRDHARG